MGLSVDRNGYVADLELNLRIPLSPATLRAFEGAGGGEMKEQRSRPAKIRALHSSAALALNVFQHWEQRDATALLDALNIDGSLQSLGFEAQFRTGLRGTPPNLDVALWLDSDRVVAIESKFTEWMTVKRAKLAEFDAKYFAGKPGLWSNLGLRRCQALAADIVARTERFRHLDALQLLKHGLGLATQRPNRCSLYYLFYDWPCEAAEKHHAEIARFASRVDDELRFESVTYQDLYEKLRARPEVDSAYIAYLGARYFVDVQASPEAR